MKTWVGLTDLASTVKFAHSEVENLRSGARVKDIPPIQVELYPILSLNTQMFVTVATGLGRWQI